MLAMTRAHTPRHPRRALRTRTVLLTGLVAALVAGGCASGGATEAAEHNAPTFRKVEDKVLRATQPISSATQLLAPSKPGEPWRVVGSVLDPDTDRSVAAVWSAEDGRTWERQEIDPEDSDVSELMSAATYDAKGLVAVGRVAGDDESDAALWRLSGGEWRLSTPAALGGKHDQWAFGVASGKGGTLIAGGENAWGEVRPRLWFSADGSSWKSVDGGPGGPLDSTGEESIQDVAAFNDGFVAVGWRDVNGSQNGVAWYSPDGLKWEEMKAPTLGVDGDGRQSVQSVVAYKDRVVAGGYWTDPSGQGKPVVWASIDGKTWGPKSGFLPSYPNYVRNATSDMSVRDITVAGDRLLAAGGDSWRPHIWQSDNGGATWRVLDDMTSGTTFDDGVDLETVAGVGNTIVALGSEPIVAELQNGRWVDRTGENFPTGGDRPAATSVMVDDDGTVYATGYSYRSRTHDQRRHYTGRIWTEKGSDLHEIKAKEANAEGVLPPQTDPNQTLYVGKVNDVARYKGGYVAVGFEDFAWAGQRTGSDSRPDGVLWTSKSGRDWDRIATHVPDVTELANLLAATVKGNAADVAAATIGEVSTQPVVGDDPAGANGTRNLEAVAPIGTGFIAVGSVYQDTAAGEAQKWDTDPIVAVSTDGKTIKAEKTGLGSPNATERFRDVCVSGDNAVAVGVSSTGGNVDVAVRVRQFGGKWSAAKSTDDSFVGRGSQEAIACSASEDGFLLVGSDSRRGNTDARVWFSKDGFSWKQLSASSLGGSGDQEARAVAAAEDAGGWLVGGVDTRGGDSDAALWRVDENGTVTRRDNDEPAFSGAGTQAVSGVYVNGKNVVVVGEDQTGVAIWRSRKLDR